MKNIIKIYKKIEEWFLIICFSIMGIVLTSQIICRYVFNTPIAWAEELARYLQIWITFIGIGFGLRSKSHIALSLLREKMPAKIGYLTELFINILIIISSILIVIAAPQFLLQQNKMASTMQISLQVIYIAIPIGFGLTIIYKLAEIVELIKKQRIKNY